MQEKEESYHKKHEKRVDIKAYEQVKKEQEHFKKMEDNDFIVAQKNKNLRTKMIQQILLTCVVTLLAATVISFLQYFITSSNNDTIELSDRIESVSESLKEASTELDYIQKELEHRIKLVEELKKDAEIAEAIIDLSQEQVALMRAMLNIELSSSDSRNFWLTFFTSFFFMVLGSIIGYVAPKVFKIFKKASNTK
jgi:predicted PurR-regulated permease PerM